MISVAFGAACQTRAGSHEEIVNTCRKWQPEGQRAKQHGPRERRLDRGVPSRSLRRDRGCLRSFKRPSGIKASVVTTIEGHDEA